MACHFQHAADAITAACRTCQDSICVAGMACVPLELHSCIGFSGDVPSGLVLHPDGRSLIYPLGSTIVVRDVGEGKQQDFLQGHTDKVSCLAISRTGRYLASGQLTYMGLKADIILWDLAERRLLHRMCLHKVKVQALDFSPDESVLASLGGQDDNSLVLWSTETGGAICGSPTGSDFTLAVRFYNNSNSRLVTGGNYNLNVWVYDAPTNKLWPDGFQLGQLRRCFSALTIDRDDGFAYAATKTGDVLQLNLERRLLRNSGPAKDLLQQGATALMLTPDGDLVAGSGDGSLVLMRRDVQGEDARFLPKLPGVARARVNGGVTSLVLSPGKPAGSSGFSFLAGTTACELYRVTWTGGELKPELLQTAHAAKITDLAFPHEYSQVHETLGTPTMCTLQVFATSSFGEIRVWHLPSRRELLRISVPNLGCTCVGFTQSGSSIISGWSDGKVRAFGPQSGKLLYTIHDAHHGAVTAIAGTPDSERLVSGGEDGAVRVWRAGKQSQVMQASMKEHKGSVNCIRIRATTGGECVSASSDGSCIIWDLGTFKRRSSLLANTFFKAVAYHPDESQIVTAGTDRKITYWDAYDGQAIRILEGSDSEQINTLALDSAGECIVSGGSDKLVKVWGYDEGNCSHTGVGHSGPVTKTAVAHDASAIVSVGTEGAILIWRCPQPQAARAQQQQLVDHRANPETSPDMH